MEEKKTGKGKIIAIIVLTLLLIINCSYIAYDKLYLPSKAHETLDEDDIEDDVEKPEVKTRSLSLAEKKILMEQIQAYNNTLSLYYPITDITTFDNQKKLMFALVNSDVSKEKEFMQSKLKQIIDSYFGGNSKTNYESINCFNDDGVLYTYDEARRIYTFEGVHGHDGIASYNTTYYYLDGTVTNESIYSINIHIIYHRYCAGTCGPALNFYKTAKDAHDKMNTVLKLEDEQELTENDYEKVKDQLDITTFTFEKDSKGNFGLKSVKVNTK